MTQLSRKITYVSTQFRAISQTPLADWITFTHKDQTKVVASLMSTVAGPCPDDKVDLDHRLGLQDEFDWPNHSRSIDQELIIQPV